MGILAALRGVYARRMDNAAIAPSKKVGRNDPCPCGSGKKFKKCCIESARLDGRRVVERNGQRILVPEGISDAALAAADEFFAAKAAGRGPAADIADFASPLLDATDGSAEQRQRALDMTMAFWNLAVIKDDRERERALDALTESFEAEEERLQFKSLAADMIERHRLMFPDMHGDDR